MRLDSQSCFLGDLLLAVVGYPEEQIQALNADHKYFANLILLLTPVSVAPDKGWA
jgi:hypothetical protein